MRLLNLTLLFVILSLSLKGQDVQIPERIFFGDMVLELNAQVRRTLKTEVDNLRRNEKYFRMKVERADLYFPIIERMFQEENVPDDFKFLALQESSLVSDAVSSSNAVGYWQFKKESGQEVGLRVDNSVDERMNIVAASRGAAKYLKRNNAVLKNWIYALLSYNMGLGGVKSEVEDKYIGAKTMKINDRMHWYVVRFLAHKLAFENEVGKSSGELKLLEYTNCSDKTLNEIAKETNLSIEEVEAYNKWLKKSRVPTDKQYVVVLPVRKDYQQPAEPVTVMASSPDNAEKEITNKEKEKPKRKPSNTSGPVKPEGVVITVHNKLKAVRAKEGDTFESMAVAGGIKFDAFLLYNELKRYAKPKPGEYYYLQPKRNKGLVNEHVISAGQTLWDVGQLYGIRSNSLRKKNRIGMKEEPKEGRVILLRSKLGKNDQPQFVKKEVKEPILNIGKPANQQGVAKLENKEKDHISEVDTVRVTINKEETIPVEHVSNTSLHAELSSPEPSPVPVEVTERNPAYQYHFVEIGETLYSLSKKYSVSVDSLIIWNHIGAEGLKAASTILVGKSSKEGTKASVSTASTQHVVQVGETLYRISKLYNVSVDDLKKWNNKMDNTVSVGETLKILSESP